MIEADQQLQDIGDECQSDCEDNITQSFRKAVTALFQLDQVFIDGIAIEGNELFGSFGF